LSDQEIESTNPGDPLNSPPDSVPEFRPVATRIQVLPFDRLTWENFERLCCRLAGKADHVEHYARYGRSGQAQQGIDIFARRSSGKYDVWQAKRCASYSAGDVRDAVDAFLAGSWRDRAEHLVLAVQCSLLDTKLQEEVEKQAARLKEMGVILLPLGGEELSERLREFPELVDDFFGREWAKAFLSTEAVNGLGSRLDGREFARVRLQLREFYHNHFHLLDIGIPLPVEAASQLAASPSLLERFTPPDVLVQERLPDDHSSLPEPSQAGWSDPYTEQDQTERAQRGRRPSRRDSLRRIALSEWLTEGSSLAAVGDAGTGKSTLLRCIVSVSAQSDVFSGVFDRGI
jgi:hypothetical protein